MTQSRQDVGGNLEVKGPLISNDSDEKAEWSQHTTQEGKIFWFHAPTKKSTWRKPDVLKTDLERLMDTQTAWKEYATADGVPYWYNKETKCSVWACPAEVQQLKQELSFVWEEFKDKAVASERLKTFFKLHGVGARTRFEEALALIKADKRFVFFSCLTTGEKKQVFSEYQSQVQKVKRERERERKAEARRIFLEHLNQWPGLHPAALLSDFKKLYEKEWWFSCLSSSEHDDLFNDCVEENQSLFEKKQKEERVTMRDQLMQYFCDEKNNFSVDSRWNDVVNRLYEDTEFLQVDPRLCLSCWENYVYSKDAEEHEARQRSIYRVQRKIRDKFRELVMEEIELGNVNARTPFYAFAEKHSSHPYYYALVGVPCSTPRDIFDRCLEPILARYEKEKSLLKKLFKNNSKWNMSIDLNTKFEDFFNHIFEIADENEKNTFTKTNLQLLLESLKRRVLRKVQGEKNTELCNTHNSKSNSHHGNTLSNVSDDGYTENYSRNMSNCELNARNTKLDVDEKMSESGEMNGRLGREKDTKGEDKKEEEKVEEEAEEEEEEEEEGAWPSTSVTHNSQQRHTSHHNSRSHHKRRNNSIMSNYNRR